MTVSTFVANVKRKTQSGDTGTTSDQLTTDIVNFLNNRMFKLWRAWPWEFSLYAISFDTVIGTTDYTMNSNVGGILALTAGTGGYLKVLTWKRYLDWFMNNQIDPVTGLATVPANGNVSHYVKLGRDSSFNLRIRLWRPPDKAITITGFGKQRITTYAVSDIAAGTSIAYFPPEVQPILEDGVCADVYEGMGQKQIAIEKNAKWIADIDELKTDASDEQDRDPTTPPPDQWIYRKRRRGGTTIV